MGVTDSAMGVRPSVAGDPLGVSMRSATTSSCPSMGVRVDAVGVAALGVSVRCLAVGVRDPATCVPQTGGDDLRNDGDRRPVQGVNLPETVHCRVGVPVPKVEVGGVELGKQLASELEPAINSDGTVSSLDGSTRGLLDHIARWKNK